VRSLKPVMVWSNVPHVLQASLEAVMYCADSVSRGYWSPAFHRARERVQQPGHCRAAVCGVPVLSAIGLGDYYVRCTRWPVPGSYFCGAHIGGTDVVKKVNTHRVPPPTWCARRDEYLALINEDDAMRAT
jgi:hypothetical protein